MIILLPHWHQFDIILDIRIDFLGKSFVPLGERKHRHGLVLDNFLDAVIHQVVNPVLDPVGCNIIDEFLSSALINRITVCSTLDDLPV